MLEASTFWDLLERRVAAGPDRPSFICDDGRRITYREFRDWAERVAAGLQEEHGVGPGVRVSWVLPTWLESMVLVAALSRLQAVQNPMLPIYREREMRFITDQIGAKLLVVPGAWRGYDYEEAGKRIAADRGGDLKILVADRRLPEADPAVLPPPPPLPERPEDAPVRWIFYTSGTTADPKGAQHTDQTVMAAAVSNARAVDLNENDVNPMVFPFTHIGGPIGLCSTLMVGAVLLVIEAFDPNTTIDFMVREGTTLGGSGTPFHLIYLAEHRKRPDEKLFANFRAYPGGGAPKPPQLHYDVKRELGGIGIVSGYGLTESPILTMHTPASPDDRLAHTEGRATHGVQLKLVKPDGTLAGPGEEGEVRAKGPQVMRGYVDSSLDADAFDEDGWFRSGDLGVLDEDGYLTITGRLKDIIIRKGENISAKEIEDMLFTHPKVADVAVIGVPDPERGEMVVAVVQTAEGAEPLGFEEMKQFLIEAELMRQKVPERLEIVPQIPRNPAGKITKHVLREQFTP